jgi:hypothetical protein
MQRRECINHITFSTEYLNDAVTMGGVQCEDETQNLGVGVRAGLILYRTSGSLFQDTL